MQTTQDEVHRLTYLANLPDINKWLMERCPKGLRYGQHLFNTAPEHITKFCAGKKELDPYEVNDVQTMYVVNNFIMFCELCWTILDVEELKLAYDLVMSEPGARRR